MRAARLAFWLLLLTPAALPGQWQDSSVVVSLLPAASADAVPSADTTRQSAPYALGEAAAGRARPNIGKRIRNGALIGAASGAAAFLLMEVTDDHWDHSYDPYICGFLVISGTTIGAVIGLLSAL